MTDVSELVVSSYPISDNRDILLISDRKVWRVITKLFITLDDNAATISRVRPEQTATKLDAPVNLDQLYTLTVLSAPYLSIRPSHQRYLHKQKQKTTTLSLGARPATPGTTLHYSKHATPTSPAHISMDAYLAFWASLSDAELL